MNWTDTEESGYNENGAGKPRQNRGTRRRTFCISHHLRDEPVRGNLRNFHDRASSARTRLVGRASSVSLLGFSGPPLATVGGAFFLSARMRRRPQQANGPAEVMMSSLKTERTWARGVPNPSGLPRTACGMRYLAAWRRRKGATRMETASPRRGGSREMWQGTAAPVGYRGRAALAPRILPSEAGGCRPRRRSHK